MAWNFNIGLQQRCLPVNFGTLFKKTFLTEQLRTTAYESEILCHWSLSIPPQNIRDTLKQFVGMQVNTGWVDSLCHRATEYLLF